MDWDRDLVAWLFPAWGSHLDGASLVDLYTTTVWQALALDFKGSAVWELVTDVLQGDGITRLSILRDRNGDFTGVRVNLYPLTGQ